MRYTADDDPSSDYTPFTTSACSSPEPRPRRRHRRLRGVGDSALRPAAGLTPQIEIRDDRRTGNQAPAKVLPKHNLEVPHSSQSPSQTDLATKLRALYTRLDRVHQTIVGSDWCIYRGWLLDTLPFAQDQLQLNDQLQASRNEIGSEEFYGTHNPMLPFLLCCVNLPGGRISFLGRREKRT